MKNNTCDCLLFWDANYALHTKEENYNGQEEQTQIDFTLVLLPEVGGRAQTKPINSALYRLSEGMLFKRWGKRSTDDLCLLIDFAQK